MISESPEALAKGGLCQICSYQKNHPALLNQTIANIPVGEQGGPLEFSFELDYHESVYFVQPVAYVHGMLHSQQHKQMIMEVQQIQALEWHQVNENRVMGLLVLLALWLLFCLVCYLGRRIVLLKMRLKYEMTDFRNIAGIKGQDSLELTQQVQLKGLDDYIPERL